MSLQLNKQRDGLNQVLERKVIRYLLLAFSDIMFRTI
jgi:hypothetical protein